MNEIPREINRAYKIISHISGMTYEGIILRTGEKCAIKLELVTVEKPRLMYELKLCKHLEVGPGFLNVIWSGCEGGYNIVVLPLLGLSLEMLLKKHTYFSLKTTIMIVDQIICRLEYIHSKDFVLRKVTTDVILMGREKTSKIVYLNGCKDAKRYRDADTKQHIKYREDNEFVGDTRFASINAHNGIEQSRRDDLESAGYLIILMLTGSLPWDNLKIENTNQKLKTVCSMKMNIPVETLCQRCPQEVARYVKYVRDLRFEAKPDYFFIRRLFRTLFLKSGFCLDFAYDWVVPKQETPTTEQAPARSPLLATGAGVGCVNDDTGEKYGPYIFRQCLGRGKHGVVYYVEHETTHAPRVIKKIPYLLERGKGDRERDSAQRSIEAEMKIGAKFGKDCTFLVNYDEITIRIEPAKGEGECIIVMEYCGAGDLRACIDDREKKSRPFSEEELVCCLFEVGTALQTLHNGGVVHRDIKPENIFLTLEGTHKLGDYGIARYVSSNATMTMAGSEGYIAPEILNGEDDYTTEVDIYSLGCVLLEMIGLRHPFKNAKNKVNVGAVLSGNANPIDSTRCSVPLLALVQSMVSVDAAKRPTIAQALMSLPVVTFLASRYTTSVKSKK